ncbi:MAG: alkaline phosphatase family protein [Syntrophales bacterium]|nr:alkaline phosphatase family protein [Syntrophales bacterium]
MPKILVIGWDGADWDLLMPWVREGKLPNLAFLLENGSHNRLASTMPPLTFPAWVSFATGVNPGRHGILDFFARIPGQLQVRLYNSRDIQEAPFWRRLSQENKKVAIQGMPLTYPLEPVNGVMLPGFDTPGLGGGMATAEAMYPSSIYQEIKEHCGGYWVVPNLVAFGPNELSQAAERLKECVINKVQVADYLLQTRDWDCFVMVLGETDAVSHYYWRFHDPHSPLHDPNLPELKNTIFEVYQEADKGLGKLLKHLPADGNLIMVSDHGMGGSSDKVIHLNQWLAQAGYLTFKKGVQGQSWWRQAQKQLLHIARDLGRRHLPHFFKKLLFRKTDIINRLESRIRYGQIDWQKTRAFSDEGFHFPSIRINTIDAEPYGQVQPGWDYDSVREEIIAGLLEWVDPWSGAKVIQNVYRREEIYSGPQASMAPDILIEWNQDGDYGYLWRPSGMAQQGTPIERLDLAAGSDSRFILNRSARHRPQGIFLGFGPAFPPGAKANGLSLVDMTPLIMYLAQASVPSNLDGRLPLEIIDPEYFKENPPNYALAAATQNCQEQPYDGPAAQEIEDRLRSLGYLD